MTTPALTFIGSGDFHHVTLALLRRLTGPFNLLVLDKHPGLDAAPAVLALRHLAGSRPAFAGPAPCLPPGRRLDFDNGFRWLAPWPDLNSGRLVVFPAVRRFRGQAWQRIPHEPLRGHPEMPVTSARVQRLLAPHRADLTRYPLYISLDKDVMTVEDALVNWDSGHLRLAEVETVLNVIRELAGESLRGMDIVGDWSPVRLQGLFRLFWHCTEHPAAEGQSKRSLPP